MKTNNNKSSARKKLVPAVAMLTVSALMLSTSTYAWFTMNKKVEVTGMEFKTKVSGNLLISDNNMEADYSSKKLTQVRKALLEPVSTINGSDGTFYYTVDALGNGDAMTDAYKLYNEDTTLTAGTAIDVIADDGDGHPVTAGAGKANVDDDFNTTYGIGTYNVGAATEFYNAYGYVDYVFYLKATGDSSDTQVKMTECNLLYKGAAIDNSGKEVGSSADQAWRAAVFCSDITTTNPGNGQVTESNATSDNLKAILTLSDAANHDSGKAVSATDAAPTALTLAYNTWSDTNGAIATVDNTDTKYLKVTVRVWLEGEDTSCTSKTYAELTDSWTLDCGFTLGNSATAVTNINSVATS